MCYLYRGVSKELHNKNKGCLIPKAINEKFEHTLKLNQGFNLNSGTTLGNSDNNAVIRHQLNQKGYSTSGISTAPHFKRAKFYATHNPTHGDEFDGIVYITE